MLEPGNYTDYTEDPDDPCLGLLERDIESGVDSLLPMGGMRRFQFLIVMRQEWDAPRVFKHDLGRANLFMCDQLNLPGGEIDLMDGSSVMIPIVMPRPDQIKKIRIYETVGSLQDLANEARGGALVAPEREPTDIWAEWFAEKERQDQYKKRNVRTLGQIVDDIIYKKREGLI